MRRKLREILRKRPRCDYRLARAMLRSQGRRLNRDRNQRILREGGVGVHHANAKRGASAGRAPST